MADSREWTDILPFLKLLHQKDNWLF